MFSPLSILYNFLQALFIPFFVFQLFFPLAFQSFDFLMKFSSIYLKFERPPTHQLLCFVLYQWKQRSKWFFILQCSVVYIALFYTIFLSPSRAFVFTVGYITNIKTVQHILGTSYKFLSFYQLEDDAMYVYSLLQTIFLSHLEINVL